MVFLHSAIPVLKLTIVLFSLLHVCLCCNRLPKVKFSCLHLCCMDKRKFVQKTPKYCCTNRLQCYKFIFFTCRVGKWVRNVLARSQFLLPPIQIGDILSYSTVLSYENAVGIGCVTEDCVRDRGVT